MAIYYVQQKATVWHEVRVEAHTPEQALQIGIESIDEGNAFEVNDSFEWADSYWLGDSEHNTIELNENE